MIGRAGSAVIFALAGLGGMPEAASAQDSTAHLDRLDEIVVTARRRAEDLQQTPVSVLAFSSEDLEARSVTNLRDLQGFVPNLTLAAQQNVGEGAGNIFIRGIGQEDFIAGSEPGVGLYIDGVYVATTRGTIFDLNDVERVEVLRGPQGTLFGKNSTGGAIQVVSVKPQPGPAARIGATVGSLNRAEVRLMLNQPLADGLMARLSLQRVSRDGHMVRLAPPFPSALLPGLDLRREGASNNLAGRLQLRWLAGEHLTLDLAAEATRKRNTQSGHRLEVLDTGASGLIAINRLIQLGHLPGPKIDDATRPDGFYETYAAGRQANDIDSRGISITLSRDVAPGALQLIFAYRTLTTHLATDTDGLWFDIANTEFHDNQRQFTAEAQFIGTTGNVDFTAGLFSLLERTRSYPTSGLRANGTLYTCNCFYPPDRRPLLSTASRSLKGESHAAYGQASIRLAPGLSATLGARLTYEAKSVDAAIIEIDPDTLLSTGAVRDSGALRDNWSAFTYRVGAELQATRELMLYASLSKGFKSGGFNVRLLSLPNLGLTAFGPETVRTFELGLRSQWFERRLRLNATLFQGEYRNLQLRQQKIIAGVTTSQVDNAGRARIRGAEVEIEALASPRLKVRAAYGHLAARYLDTGNVPGLTLDSQFQRTPSHSFAASGAYTVPLSGGSLIFNADYTYRSKEQFQIVASPVDQSAYGLASARATWRPAKGSWSLAIFATNLTGQYYRVAGRNNTSIAGQPRLFGIQFEATLAEVAR